MHVRLRSDGFLPRALEYECLARAPFHLSQCVAINRATRSRVDTLRLETVLSPWWDLTPARIGGLLRHRGRLQPATDRAHAESQPLTDSSDRPYRRPRGSDAVRRRPPHAADDAFPRRAAAAGELRRNHAGVYTDDLKSPLEAV